MSRSKVFVTVVFAALAAGTNGHAFHTPAEPLVTTLEFQESVHAVWRIDVPPGASFTVEWEGKPTSADLLAYGYWLLDPADLALEDSGFGYFAGQPALTQVGSRLGTVRFHGVGMTGELACALDIGCGFYGVFQTFPRHPEGQTWILLTLAGVHGTMDGRINIYGDPGIVAERLGDGPAFVHREQDFHGDLNILATLYGPTARIKAIQNVEVREQIQHQFFGRFLGFSNSGDLTMSAETPPGQLGDATDYRFDGTPPGNYAFSIDHNVDLAVLGVSSMRIDVVAAGADVDLTQFQTS